MEIIEAVAANTSLTYFTLGQIVSTPGACDLLERTGNSAFDLLMRHQHGDWGSVPAEDAMANDWAVVNEERILSSYYLTATERLWIITEWDRSVTTLLLPEDY